MSIAPFSSRLGLIENLRQHLLKGKWAVMSGGAMIGKTTLAAALARRINDGEHRAVSVSLKNADPGAGLWPLLFEALLREGLAWNKDNPYRKDPASLPELMTQIHHLAEKTPPRQRAIKLILLIDDCGRLLPEQEKYVSQIANMAMELTDISIHAICWIGGLTWDDWARTHAKDFILPLRFYPLSVVPIREARQIIEDHLDTEAVEPVWNATGGHPYLLEQAFAKENGSGVEPLAQLIYAELKPEEDAVLDQLDPKGAWTPLEALKGADGQRAPKRCLDRLCMAGLVVRTLDHGTAVARWTAPRLAESRKR